MSLGVKIIMTAINLMCLVVTLIYPSNITAISLLPSWITAGGWLYLRVTSISSSRGIHKAKNILFTVSFVFLVVCTTISLLIGFICEYANCTGMYDFPCFVLKEGVVLPFEVVIDYGVFEKFVFIIFAIYFALEIFLTGYGKVSDSGEDYYNKNSTPNEVINNNQ